MRRRGSPASVLVAACLVGCGGGESDAPATPAPPRPAPVGELAAVFVSPGPDSASPEAVVVRGPRELARRWRALGADASQPPPDLAAGRAALVVWTGRERPGFVVERVRWSGRDPVVEASALPPGRCPTPAVVGGRVLVLELEVPGGAAIGAPRIELAERPDCS